MEDDSGKKVQEGCNPMFDPRRFRDNQNAAVQSSPGSSAEDGVSKVHLLCGGKTKGQMGILKKEAWRRRDCEGVVGRTEEAFDPWVYPPLPHPFQDPADYFVVHNGDGRAGREETKSPLPSEPVNAVLVGNLRRRVRNEDGNTPLL